jgi:hypothetical protein
MEEANMFIGHYAPAFIAATLPKAPRLGTLFIAAQLVDLAFFIFVIIGVEEMRLTPGITAMNALDLYSMPYTHSLLGSLVFGGGTTIVVWPIMRQRLSGEADIANARLDGGGTTIVIWPKALVAGLIAGAVVVSHWFLDFAVHAPDLTIAGSPPKLGLGLWNYPLIEMPLELGITGAALGYYLSRTKTVAGADLKPVYWLCGAMLVIQLYNWLAPEPDIMDMILPVSALLAFALFIWLAYRLDRTRVPKITTKG